MNPEEILVIVNPRSANGTTAQEWPYLEKRIRQELGALSVVLTRAAGEATEIARKGVQEGFRTFIGVGGDGTNNEIVNGFFEGERLLAEGIAYGQIPRGTGCDWVKVLKIPRETDSVLMRLKQRQKKRIDLGKITFLKDNSLRYFINIADFGIGGEAVDRVNRTTKRFGGFISFLVGTVLTILNYKNKKVSLISDGNDLGEQTIFSVNVANGQYFGGGMWIAPHALIDDGYFDVVWVEAMGTPETLISMSTIYRGTHLKNQKIHVLKTKKLEAYSDEKVLIDVDGEQVGNLPARFEIVPKVIDVFI
ncbi:MAG: diacylglycerol kinase family lipid kinase [Deltaproteobacteria bacterium]|nr:diacylglycerol kinase family lipid kinase [Deltaproteobacteria bacterium]